MAKKIKLLRPKNINLIRRPSGDVLSVGKDVMQGRAETLVRIGAASWVDAPKKAKKKSA